MALSVIWSVWSASLRSIVFVSTHGSIRDGGISLMRVNVLTEETSPYHSHDYFFMFLRHIVDILHD